MKLHKALIAAGLLAGAAAAPAYARPDIAVAIGFAPPAPMVEVVPHAHPGHVWMPGYWAWHRDRYIWIRGRWVLARPGQVWVPDRWIQTGPRWQLRHGHWEREHRGRGHAHGRHKH